MQVRQCAPPLDHPASRFVISFWSLQTRPAFATETILPKGNVDLLFNLGAPLRITLGGGGQVVLSPGAWIAGLQARAIASQPQGAVHMFGVSLAAERCAALFPFPMHEITGWIRPGVDAFDDAAFLAERLHALVDFGRRVRLVLDWLLPSCEPFTSKQQRVHGACDWLARASGGCGINGLARSLGFSPRHLRRLFLEHVGVTPGHYLRLSRFVRSLHLMAANRSLTDVAHGACYFDQAHFCRDFRDIAGLTPGEYRAGVGPAIGHLFQA